MRLLRTLPTARLIVLVATVLAVFAGAAALGLAASGGSGEAPPPEPLAEAVHDALAAPAVSGVTARVTFTNKLFPSGALLGSAGPVLVSGGSGRLWMTGDGYGRIELQSDAGDAQIVWTPTGVTIYDASSNTVYHAALPAAQPGPGAADTPPSLARVTEALTKLGAHATISVATPTTVAGRPAYSVSLSPAQDGGLLGAVEVAWDAEHGIPLRVGVYARGATSPVLELTATDISFGPVDQAAVDVKPPAGARVVELGQLTGSGGGSEDGTAVTGLAAVQAAAAFPVTAPDVLAGLPRSDVRLVGGGASRSALVTYGRGLGAIVVAEREATSGGGTNGLLGSLPAVSLAGISAHELATPLGTVVTWQSNGLSTTVAGSVTAATAEAAARELG